jgi:predicted CXXCH cytochrome family protein
MRVILRRRVDEATGEATPAYRHTLFEVERLSIGRGADQLLQIADGRLAPAHATIERQASRLLLSALTDSAVPVNGHVHRQCELVAGDVLLLADRHLTVETLRQDVVVLRLGRLVPGGSAVALPVQPQYLEHTGIKASPLAWTLVLAVLVVGFALPFGVSLARRQARLPPAAAVLTADTLWAPGPLHPAHQFIGADCGACHRKTFNRISDQACGQCHHGVPHHVPLASAARPSFAAMRCAQCHVEHRLPSALLDRSSTACVGCHRDLRAIEPRTDLHNATDFGSDHPDFALALVEPEGRSPTVVWKTKVVDAGSAGPPAERSNLKFSHQVHLDQRGIDSPTGKQVLNCANCHRPDAGGRRMVPIKMEAHCGQCHQLLFDEHDPGSLVPHGALALLFTALQEHFSRMFLLNASADALSRRRPGGEQAVLTQDEQRRARAWTLDRSLQAAGELLEKRVCVECHTVTRQPDKVGFDQWQVEPVRLTTVWMPRAEFSHAAHRSSACIDCHRGAPTSRDSTDVLMPAIKNCRTCHGGPAAGQRVASDCAMCHRLHVPGRGDMAASSASAHVPPIAASLQTAAAP